MPLRVTGILGDPTSGLFNGARRVSPHTIQFGKILDSMTVLNFSKMFRAQRLVVTEIWRRPPFMVPLGVTSGGIYRRRVT